MSNFNKGYSGVITSNDIANNPVDFSSMRNSSIFITIEGNDYTNWNFSDDSYIIKYVNKLLGLKSLETITTTSTDTNTTTTTSTDTNTTTTTTTDTNTTTTSA